MSVSVGFNTNSGPSATVAFSESAAAQVKKLQTGDNAGKSLRVQVSGGGCSGFQYGFKLDDAVPGDHQVETNGVTLLVDAASLQLIAGGEVDFVTDLVGSQFVVKNPNATSTCGCGASFSI